MGEPGRGVTEARGRVGFRVMRAANSSQRIRDECSITTDEEPLCLATRGSSVTLVRGAHLRGVGRSKVG